MEDLGQCVVLKFTINAAMESNELRFEVLVGIRARNDRNANALDRVATAGDLGRVSGAETSSTGE